MASGKEFTCLLERGKRDGERVSFHGAVIEFAEFANAGADAATCSEGPERAIIRTHRQFFLRSLAEESSNVGVRSARKEKQLVKIALPNQVGLANFETGVLSQLTVRQGAQPHHVDTGFFGQQIESLCGSGLRRGCRDTGEAAKANRMARLEVEIVLREEDAGTAFGNKGCRVPKPAKRGIKLKTVAGRDPDAGNTVRGERIEELREAEERLSGDWDEIVDGTVNDSGGRAQRMPRVREELWPKREGLVNKQGFKSQDLHAQGGE